MIKKQLPSNKVLLHQLSDEPNATFNNENTTELPITTKPYPLKKLALRPDLEHANEPRKIARPETSSK